MGQEYPNEEEENLEEVPPELLIPESERPSFGPLPITPEQETEAERERLRQVYDLASREAASRRAMAGIFEGAAGIGSAISGAPVNKEFYGRLYAQGGEPQAQAREIEKAALEFAEKQARGRERRATEQFRATQLQDAKRKAKETAASEELMAAQMRKEGYDIPSGVHGKALSDLMAFRAATGRAEREEKKETSEEKHRAESERIAREKLILDKAEAARRAAEAAAKAEQDAKNAKDNMVVGYGNVEFRLKEGYGPPPEAIRAEFYKKASAASTIQSQLDEVAKDLKEIIRNPTEKTMSSVRGRLESRQGLIAPTINMALGQGAMAAGEYERVKQSLGDIQKAEFWADALRSATGSPEEAGALLARISAAKGFFNDSVMKYADTLNMESAPRGTKRKPPGPRPTGRMKKDQSGQIWIEMSDGTAKRAGPNG